eukprot:362749-Chlamydomonas_euryale.AAC.7
MTAQTQTQTILNSGTSVSQPHCVAYQTGHGAAHAALARPSGCSFVACSKRAPARPARSCRALGDRAASGVFLHLGRHFEALHAHETRAHRGDLVRAPPRRSLDGGGGSGGGAKAACQCGPS